MSRIGTTLKYNLTVAQKNLIKFILNKPKIFSSNELFKFLTVFDIELDIDIDIEKL